MTEQAQYISGRTVQEQMDNLIKYVDDRSKTVAEEEAQRVLVPAENAKVAAEAAADRAVSSVGQFESRLGGVEDGVAGNRSSTQTIDGEITDIYNDLTNCVRKVGEAGQVVMNGLDLRGNNSVPDTVIGQNDSKPVNGKRVIGELNAYEPMVRTTGNQTVNGIKSIPDALYMLGPSFRGSPGTARKFAVIKNAAGANLLFVVMVVSRYNTGMSSVSVTTDGSSITVSRIITANASSSSVKIGVDFSGNDAIIYVEPVGANNNNVRIMMLSAIIGAGLNATVEYADPYFEEYIPTGTLNAVVQ